MLFLRSHVLCNMVKILLCRRIRGLVNAIAVCAFLVFCVHYITAGNRNRQKWLYLSYLKSFTSNTSHSKTEQLKVRMSCSKPDLPMWSQEVENYIDAVSPIQCKEQNEWIYTTHGRFYISQKAKTIYGNIKCRYTPYVIDKDEYKSLDPIEDFQNGSKLLTDVFHVLCRGKWGKRFERYYPCISEDGVKPLNSKNMYNIFMFGVDSLSRLMFMRLLPKTFSYFTEELQGEVLEGYNILGDGTPAALMPILTGQQETETAEMRRGQPGAVYVDEALDFIWKDFEKKGYVTQWGEDEQGTAAFNLRLLGFKNQPTHHYIRPFYQLVEPLYRHQSKFCYGSKPRHRVLIDWLKEGLVTNRGKPFFTFGFFTELSHDNNNPVHLCDDDLKNFLQFMKSEEFFKQTIFILMSDHGARHGELRATEQGKLEERMPFVGVYLPESFKKRYPDKVNALKVNTKRLTSPFDIYETFREVLGEFRESDVSFTRGRGSSLFKEISNNRTCSEIGIEAHWCACMTWEPMAVSDDRAIAATNKVVSVINEMLIKHKSLCHILTISSINRAVVYKSTDQVLKFKKSQDADGRVPDMNDNLKAAGAFIQVTFMTSPGKGLFEATVRHGLQSGRYTVNDQDISRLNWYGDASKCIAYTFPKLRPYCVCK